LLPGILYCHKWRKFYVSLKYVTVSDDDIFTMKPKFTDALKKYVGLEKFYFLLLSAIPTEAAQQGSNSVRC